MGDCDETTHSGSGSAFRSELMCPQTLSLAVEVTSATTEIRKEQFSQQGLVIDAEHAQGIA